MTFHFLFWILLIPFFAEARWATHEDAALQLNDRTQIETVRPDGTSEMEITEELEVLKDSGREAATVQRLYYNEFSEKVSILDAYTLTEGQKHKVDPATIEDKPMASFGAGFDQERQILLVYPRVAVGSKVYLKYKVERTQVPLENVFSSIPIWGQSYYWKKSQNIILSAIPLKIKVNDPQHVLKVKESKEGKLQKISITQTKPLYAETVQDGNWVAYKKLTWVSLSSLKNWEELSRRSLDGWEKVLVQPLPERFEAIEQKAKKQKTEVGQINTVTSLLSETIQYMGDWRTVEGRLWPRSLAKIAETHIGDCKDFSVVTVAILRKLGFQAYVVLVNRGVEVRDFEEALPFYDANHAMVKAIGKSGKIYWVDPTNLVSMAQGIFPDVAGKHAFVLDPKNPSREKIPEVSLLTNQTVADRALTIQKDCSIDVSGKAIFKGESALEWAGKGLVLSPKGIEEEIISTSVGEPLEKEDKRTVEMPDLTKRIVEDLVFKYTYHQRQGVKRTNRGYYLEIPAMLSLLTAEDQVSDMFLGSPPITLKKVRVIKGGTIENTQILNAEIKTPWVEAKRVCTQEKEGLHMEDTLVIKTRFIPADDLKGLVYKKLAKDLKFYFDVGIVTEVK